MLIDFRERRKEREGERNRNIHVRQKHRPAASHRHPDRVLNPQPRYVP